MVEESALTARWAAGMRDPDDCGCDRRCDAAVSCPTKGHCKQEAKKEKGAPDGCVFA